MTFAWRPGTVEACDGGPIQGRAASGSVAPVLQTADVAGLDRKSGPALPRPRIRVDRDGLYRLAWQRRSAAPAVGTPAQEWIG